MSDLVTVVVPTYNREVVIVSAINSILTQSYQNIEVIVVNDGSCDGTKETIIDLAQKNCKVRYIEHNQKLGAQAARNSGIRAAKGKWIAFLDSDDKWLPDSLERRLFLAQTMNVDVVYSECYIIRNNSHMEIFGIPKVRSSSHQTYVDLLTKPGPMFQSLLVKAEAFQKIGYLDEAVISYQEWDTSIQLAKHRYLFAFLEDPTFIYDCRGDDTISKSSYRCALGYQYVVNKHSKDILMYAGFKAMSQHCFNLSVFYKEIQLTKCLIFFFSGYYYWSLYLFKTLTNYLKS